MYFPTTRWTLLADASLNDDAAGRTALNHLCRQYWKPLVLYIQLRGHSPTEAEDLTQEFIVHLMEHATLARADRERGRFRSFLLGALTHFLHDQRDRHRALKRGGAIAHESFDMDPANSVGAVPPPEASVFDREWALVILESALAQTRSEYEQEGRGPLFAALQQFLPGALDVPTYEAVAARLQLSLPAAKTEIHRLRQRFRARVRQHIAATVEAPHEVDGEMDYLGRVLMDRGSDLSRKLSHEYS